MLSQPRTTSRDDVTAEAYAAALGITPESTEYWFTDQYGLTYRGVPSHVTLAALAHSDFTQDLFPFADLGGVSVPWVARIVIGWFTSVDTDPVHAVRFAALSPWEVCELVVYLWRYGHGEALAKVGPQTLHHYTSHLLLDMHKETVPVPQLVDQPTQPLVPAKSNLCSRLQVTVTAPDGADEVPVPVQVDVTENLNWRVKTAIPLSVEDLTHLLVGKGFGLSEHLNRRTDLIEDFLTYDAADSIGHDVTAWRLSTRREHRLDERPDAPVEVSLFFVGPDRDTALATAPFSSRELAEASTGSGDQVFHTTVDVEPIWVRAVQ